MSAAAHAVRASGLEWTLVRIPMLTDNPAQGQPKVGLLGKGAGMRLTRGDLATFMLQQAASRTYVHQAPVVSN
jgi:hypothetical protein